VANDDDPGAEHLHRELVFGVDKESGKVAITVLDRATGELVRSIPQEQVLRISPDLFQSVELLFKPHS